MDLCPCGSNKAYGSCCQPVIKGEKHAATAEQLMRSRYSAYVKVEMEHIFTSLHPSYRTDYDEKKTRAWAENSEWHGMQILRTIKGGIDDQEAQVEFTVSYTESGMKQEHHELASFKKKDDVWYFTTGKNMPKIISHTSAKIGRNDPCSCGSGKKYKKCCGA